MAEGAMVKIVAPKHGSIKTADGKEIKVDETWLTTGSVLFDAVYVPGGKQSVETLGGEPDAFQFVNEAFKHCKAIAAVGRRRRFCKRYFCRKSDSDKAVILGENDEGNGEDLYQGNRAAPELGARNAKSSGVKIFLKNKEKQVSS